jgi:hypothetical protein
MIHPQCSVNVEALLARASTFTEHWGWIMFSFLAKYRVADISCEIERWFREKGFLRRQISTAYLKIAALRRGKIEDDFSRVFLKDRLQNLAQAYFFPSEKIIEMELCAFPFINHYHIVVWQQIKSVFEDAQAMEKEHMMSIFHMKGLGERYSFSGEGHKRLPINCVRHIELAFSSLFRGMSLCLLWKREEEFALFLEMKTMPQL